MQPLSIGIYWVLERLESGYIQAGDGSPRAVSLRDITLAIYAFVNSERAFQLLLEDEDMATFEREAQRFALKLNRETLPLFNEWINREFELLGLAAKKPTSEATAEARGEMGSSTSRTTGGRRHGVVGEQLEWRCL